MEYNKVEVEVVEIAAAEGVEAQVRELEDLQLMMVGGGGVEVIFG